MRNIFRIWEKREAKRISGGAEVLKKWRTEDTFHAHKRKRISFFPKFKRRDEYRWQKIVKLLLGEGYA